ncbi:MAG: hypothetical protein ABIE68_00105 [bacterium]
MKKLFSFLWIICSIVAVWFVWDYFGWVAGVVAIVAVLLMNNILFERKEKTTPRTTRLTNEDDYPSFPYDGGPASSHNSSTYGMYDGGDQSSGHQDYTAG